MMMPWAKVEDEEGVIINAAISFFFFFFGGGGQVMIFCVGFWISTRLEIMKKLVHVSDFFGRKIKQLRTTNYYFTEYSRFFQRVFVRRKV